MNSVASLGAGGLTGGSGFVATVKMCEDAGFNAAHAQACSEHFGAFAGWAAVNPEMAAFVLGAVGFGVTQLGQWAVGKYMEKAL